MPRTLVTGATGFIGSHVVRLLPQRGDEVVVTVRSGLAACSAEGLESRTRARRHPRPPARSAAPCRASSACFTSPATTDLTRRARRTFPVDVEGTTIVLEEALRAGVQRAVYTSSVAADRSRPRRAKTADETTVWEAGRYAIPYLDAKHEAETAALRLVARGLPLVIVNPAHVLGRRATRAARPPRWSAGSCAARSPPTSTAR